MIKIVTILKSYISVLKYTNLENVTKIFKKANQKSSKTHPHSHHPLKQPHDQRFRLLQPIFKNPSKPHSYRNTIANDFSDHRFLISTLSTPTPSIKPLRRTFKNEIVVACTLISMISLISLTLVKPSYLPTYHSNHPLSYQLLHLSNRPRTPSPTPSPSTLRLMC